MVANEKNGKTKSELNVAVVGLRHGVEHVDVIEKRGDMSLSAVCDRDAGLSIKVGEAKGLPKDRCFDDFNRMLEESRPDVVVIATPVRTHAELAEAALTRGVHVLLEKPMTHDLESARRLVKAAARSKAVLQIGFEFRSSPLIRKVREIISSGELGRIVVVWTTMFRGPGCAGEGNWRGQVGLFFDCMIHEIDGMLEFAGADFEQVAAFGAPQGCKSPKAPDRPPHTVSACAEFENAVRGSIAFSELSQTYDNTHFGVVGDKGRIDGGLWEPEGAGSLKVYTHGGIYRTTIDIDGQKAYRGHLGFSEQYDSLISTIRDGAPNISDALNAFRTQRFLAAMDIAMSENRIVRRNELPDMEK